MGSIGDRCGSRSPPLFNRSPVLISVLLCVPVLAEKNTVGGIGPRNSMEMKCQLNTGNTK